MALTPRQLAASLHFRDRKDAYDRERIFDAVSMASNGTKQQRTAWLKALGLLDASADVGKDRKSRKLKKKSEPRP